MSACHVHDDACRLICEACGCCGECPEECACTACPDEKCGCQWYLTGGAL